MLELILTLKILYAALLFFLLLEIFLYLKVSQKVKKFPQFAAPVLRTLNLLLYVLLFFGFYLSYGRFPIIYARENLYFLSLTVYVLTFFFFRKREGQTLTVTSLLVSLLLLLLSNLPFYKPEPASPFLESIWLYIHAGAAAIAHAFYLMAFVVTAIVISGYVKRRDFSELDKRFLMLIKNIRLAFAFYTVMIGSGAIWAQKAWGRMRVGIPSRRGLLPLG